MSDCIIRSGEIVHLDDPRLNDQSCVIEPGAIIRPPTEQIVEPITQKVEEPKKKPSPKRVEKKESAAVDQKKTEVVVVPSSTQVKVPEVVKREVVEVPQPPPKVDEGLSSSDLAAGAAVLGVAAIGTAAATSAMGGISAVQAKITSLFGSKAAAVTAAAGVTAGTIVAVKALEAKMGNLERDMNKAKEEVGGAASSISRIDELLDRLSSNGNDKLDPPV